MNSMSRMAFRPVFFVDPMQNWFKVIRTNQDGTCSALQAPTLEHVREMQKSVGASVRICGRFRAAEVDDAVKQWGWEKLAVPTDYYPIEWGESAALGENS